MKKTAIFILFSLLINFSVAQYTQTIRGIVTDKDSKSPVTGVTVVVLNSEPQKYCITDEKGYYRIPGVNVGMCNIKISLLGYNEMFLNNVELKSGKELVLNIQIEEKVYEQDEIVIRANKPKDKALNEMAVVSARSFTVEETERFAGTWYDPARMAANYAGVAAAGDQRNDIIIRGNSPAGLLWKLENVDIPNPNHFGALGTTGGPISILNNNLLDNSDFFTGAFPAEYGNAMSGVFDLRMRSGNNENYEFTAQVGMNGFEAGLEGPFPYSKSSYLVNYRYSTLKIFDMLGINFGVSGIPQYQDISYKFNFPDTKMGTFSVFGVGGISYIEVLYKNKKDDDWTFGKPGYDFRFGSDMGVTGISNTYFFNKKSSLKTTFAVSGTQTASSADSAFIDKESVNYYGDKSSEVKYSLNTKFNSKLNIKNTLNFGINTSIYNVNYSDSALLPNYTYRKLSEASNEFMLLSQSYLQIKHKFNNKIILTGGFHAQHFSLNNTYTIEPRLGLQWKIKPSHTISFGTGMHSQLQPRLFYFYETYTTEGDTVLTNYNLDFSKSNQAVLAYDYLINKNLRLKLETYYQHLSSIPVEQNSSTFSMINYGTTFYTIRRDSLVNEGKGKNYGLELTLEKFLSDNYYFLITASLFESKYTASDNVERNTIFNGNFVCNLLSGYTFDINDNNTLKLDFKTVFAGGKNYIPVDLEASRAAGTEILDYSRAYEPSYDDYFRLDGRITYKLNARKFNTEIAFDVQNITQRKNILLETYNVESGEIKYDYQLGLFYVFLIRFQF